jgi:hypothetical protein
MTVFDASIPYAVPASEGRPLCPIHGLPLYRLIVGGPMILICRECHQNKITLGRFT